MNKPHKSNLKAHSLRSSAWNELLSGFSYQEDITHEENQGFTTFCPVCRAHYEAIMTSSDDESASSPQKVMDNSARDFLALFQAICKNCIKCGRYSCPRCYLRNEHLCAECWLDQKEIEEPKKRYVRERFLPQKKAAHLPVMYAAGKIQLVRDGNYIRQQDDMVQMVALQAPMLEERPKIETSELAPEAQEKEEQQESEEETIDDQDTAELAIIEDVPDQIPPAIGMEEDLTYAEESQIKEQYTDKLAVIEDPLAVLDVSAFVERETKEQPQISINRLNLTSRKRSFVYRQKLFISMVTGIGILLLVAGVLLTLILTGKLAKGSLQGQTTPSASPHATVASSTNTPASRNTSIINVTSPITSNTIWSPDAGIYTLEHDLTIQNGSTLVIEAGTTVHLAPGANLIVAPGASLEIDGVISASANANAMSTIFQRPELESGLVTITSSTNQPWGSIILEAPNSFAMISGALIEHGGVNPLKRPDAAMIENRGGALNITHSIVASSASSGVANTNAGVTRVIDSRFGGTDKNSTNVGHDIATDSQKNVILIHDVFGNNVSS